MLLLLLLSASTAVSTAASTAVSTTGIQIDPCTSGKNITLDGKTYDTKYAIEIPSPEGTKRHVDGINTPVSARVIGTLANGSVFWDSKGPFEYNFNATPRHLIVGFDVGSYGMKVGETRKLCIPENEGYGPAGRPPVIPPDSTLIFQLECLSVGAAASASQSVYNAVNNTRYRDATCDASEEIVTVSTELDVCRPVKKSSSSFIRVTCSSDGSMFNEHYYADSNCTELVSSGSFATGSCLENTGYTFSKFECVGK